MVCLFPTYSVTESGAAAVILFVTFLTLCKNLRRVNILNKIESNSTPVSDDENDQVPTSQTV